MSALAIQPNLCTCGGPVMNKKRGLCSRCYQKLRNLEGPFMPLNRLADQRARELWREEKLNKQAEFESHIDEIKAAREARERQRIEAAKAEITAKEVAEQERIARAMAWATEIARGTRMIDIAVREGLSRERVRQLLARYGFPTKPKPVAIPTRYQERTSLMTDWGKRMVSIIHELDLNIERRGPNECWFWQDSRNLSVCPKSPHVRYPRIRAFDPLDSRRARNTHVHRVIYSLFKGPIPAGMTVDHICFNTLCCNPAHLQLLTRAENSARKDPRRKKKNPPAPDTGKAGQHASGDFTPGDNTHDI